MPPPQRTRFPTGVAGLEWLLTDGGSRTLVSEAVGETYHSGCGAAAESLFVYLLNSGVAARLTAQQPTRVLEVGFGTGTAFLLTAAFAEHCRTRLHYTACDKWLLPTELYQDLDVAACVEGPAASEFFTASSATITASHVQALQAAWLAARSQLDHSQLDHSQLGRPSSRHRLQLTEWVMLDLVIGEVQAFSPSEEEPYHAVYFDPFSPETTPELWTPAIFQTMFDSLQPNGTLTSYCVKGAIRRTLQSVGFQVSKCPGPPGGKREVLVARRPHAQGVNHRSG